jgi:hypothetical protein
MEENSIMSLYLGNNLIAPNQSNAANKSLSNLDNTGQSILNNKADRDLSNLNETGEKHFLNKTQISNCILEAPNGVITYSGNTVTLKAGVKVLIPDGRNSDGSLKSIEITVPFDKTYTTQSYQANRTHQPIFIDNMGDLQYANIASNGYFITDGSTSGTYDANYSPKTNVMKITQGTAGNWKTVQYCYIGWMSIDSNLNITSVHIEQPIRLFTSADSSYMSSMGMPSDKYINLTLGASGSTYTAPSNGWFIFARRSSSTGQSIELMNQNIGLGSRIFSGSTSPVMRIFIPVRKNDVVGVNYEGTNTANQIFRFIYAQGSESEAS